MLPEMSLSKITRPGHQNIYLRESFFSVLDNCVKKPVIAFIAPQGAGKTTLVSSYIESRHMKCLWYQLDPADKDPATFFHYLSIGAENASPGASANLPHLTPEYLAGTKAFTREYFSRLYKSLGKKAFIVFDNYHELPEDSPVHELLGHGLAVRPEGVNIVIIGRSSLPADVSRLRLEQKMEVVTWEELRLTVEEIIGIAAERGRMITEQEGRRMLARTGGWAAGVALTLDGIHGGPIPFDRRHPDIVFNYFADELFSKFSDEVKGFLLKTSILPVMTVEMAGAVSGNSNAPSIISELVDTNCFIQGHQGDSVFYEYHNLFRDFLLSRAVRTLDRNEFAGLEKKTADLLASNGRAHDAMRLYHRLGDWEAMTGLLLSEAPAMVGQGRHQALNELLDLVPANVLKKAPWLLYWKGCCRLPFDQIESRSLYEKSFELFHVERDTAGLFLSWCGIVESVVQGFDDLKGLERTIEAMRTLLLEYPAFPSKDIECRVSVSMFIALSFRAPEHPDINVWLDRTRAVLEAMPDPGLYSLITLYLVDYHLWAGELPKAELLVQRMGKMLEKGCESPMPLIAGKLTEALNHWYHGRLQNCLVAVSEGLSIAETSGVNIFNYFLCGHGAVAHLTGGDAKNAGKYIGRMASVLDNNKRLCASYYHHLAACGKLLQKDLPGALEDEGRSLSLAVKIGSPFGEAMSRTGMALIYHELGEKQKAASEVVKARKLAVRTKSGTVEFVANLFEAYFALSDGKRRKAVKRLKLALSTGARFGLVNFHMWQPDMMAALSLLALDEGIETGYVKRLIAQRGIFPENPPLQSENWPWRLRIHVLGRFSIIKDGVPLQYSKKAPRKILDMLKLIIALGGDDIPENRILDALWQNAEGDAAHAAFTMTLKRLRLLLGFDDAILLRNGCVTLNQRYCWVDAYAFEALLSRADSGHGILSDEEAFRSLKKAISLYRTGHDAESESRWSFLFYERVKSKFVRAVLSLGARLEESGHDHEAIDCYKKGIECEPFSETLYQVLMELLHRHGKKAEALALYRRMARLFEEVLGTAPSARSQKLFKTISLD